MPRKYPKVDYTEQALREGMQIEDANISIEDKVRLLDAVSETGLKKISVGSFVSPRYTPQMARMDEIMKMFHPKPGVTYVFTALNERGVERAREYSPPLTIEREERNSLNIGLDDIFSRRNTNRGQREGLANWPRTVAAAKQRGAKEAGFGVGHAWGGNFIGRIPVEVTMRMLELEHSYWDEAGIKVTSCSLGDTMGWNMPHQVKETLSTIKGRWPEVTRWSFHHHNSRGTALATAFTILDTLTEEDEVHMEGTLGGCGGCPYCGHGRSTGMMPTEDFMNMLEEMGIDTGVDLKKLIQAVWMLEEIIGRQLVGQVSKCGPSPSKLEDLFDPNMPFVETAEQAKHFITGPKAYEGGINPWREPITSPYRDRLEKGLPAYDMHGDWPWKEDWFPQPPKKK
ncbi:MAG: citramalate synthase [Chloroflexota bacterium]